MYPIRPQNGGRNLSLTLSCVCVSTENYVSENTIVKKTSNFTDFAELVKALYVVRKSPDLKTTD